MPIPALSLSRPWTALVLDGHKGIENRTWRTAYRGPLIIHGAKSFDRYAGNLAHDVLAWSARWFLADDVVERAYAAGYLGVVQLTGVCSAQRPPEGEDQAPCECGPWAMPDQFHFTLTDPAWFPTPIDGPGRQKVWTPDDQTVQRAANDLLRHQLPGWETT